MTLESSGDNQRLGRVEAKMETPWACPLRAQGRDQLRTCEEPTGALCDRGLVGREESGQDVAGREGGSQTVGVLLAMLSILVFLNESNRNYWRVLSYLTNVCLSVLIWKMVL